MSSKPNKIEKRMGNPRTIPLRPEDLDDVACLEKFIFPRLLDIVNQTEASNEQFKQLISDFITYWDKEKDKQIKKATQTIMEELKSLPSKDRIALLQTLKGFKDQEE